MNLLDSIRIEPDEELLSEFRGLLERLSALDQEAQIETINSLREELHKHSPFRNEPVDCVLWVPAGLVGANDYNPNAVAPPEMKLLEHSIAQDGYTQPIVAWRRNGAFEVVDGFHRNRVGKESKAVRDRLLGRLPLTIVNESRLDRNDRIAATIRHNRARGKHRVDSMSDIVVELKRRNWTNERISRELGMEDDEILRLCQITGMAELFSDQEFSKAWDVEGSIEDSDFEELTEDVADESEVRTANTNDPQRIFHRHEEWECWKAGFYKNSFEGKSKAECEEAYRDFLADSARFESALRSVTSEWKHSCEHYLTNVAMNRIAWLGQASMCYATGIPAAFRGGFSLLTAEQQSAANELALKYLNLWLEANSREPVDMATALGGGRQSDIY